MEKAAGGKGEKSPCNSESGNFDASDFVPYRKRRTKQAGNRAGPNWLRKAGCDGNKSFPDFKTAKAVRNRSTGDEFGGRAPYHCEFCRKWHLGTPIGRKKVYDERMIDE